MQKWHRSSSAVAFSRRALQQHRLCDRCAASRHFHASPLLHDENDATKPARPTPTTQRQRAQIAGRTIQGLRGAAPGGFSEGPGRRPPSQSRGPALKGPSTPGANIIRTASGPRSPQGDNQSGPRIIKQAYGPSRESDIRDLANLNQPKSVSRAPGRGMGRPQRGGRGGSRPSQRPRNRVEEAEEDEFEDKEVETDAAMDMVKQEEQELYAHLEWADKQVRGVPKAFKPPIHKTDDLVTNRTSTFVGTQGAKAELETAMSQLSRRDDISWGHDEPLARRLIAGKLVRFRDEEEKERVVKLAEDFAARTANFIQAKKGEFVEKEDVGFVPIPETYRKMLGDRAMAGHYPPVEGIKGSNQEEKTMSHLKTSLQLNSTYSPSQAKALAEFVEKMWPGQKTQQRKRS